LQFEHFTYLTVCTFFLFMKKIILLIFAVAFSLSSYGQKSSHYQFLLYESMPYGTSMKKMSLNSLTISRLAFNTVNWDSLNETQQSIAWGGIYIAQLLLVPIVHEEGHRSVLTSNGIAGISRQFFDKNGIATVTGLSDQKLQDLRDNALPDYIRLHSSGLESEYLIKSQSDEIVGFREDDLVNILGAQTASTFGVIGYNLTSLFPGMFTPIEEGNVEENNDIVGHDIYGMVKNLYRPNDSFYRYTNYDHLTKVEKQYIKNGAYSSLLNLLSPSYLSFKTKNARLSFGGGFTYSPFGGAYRLSIWRLAKQKISVSVQLFTNRYINTPGLLVTWKDVQIAKKLNLTFNANVFSQPESLSFETKNKFVGYLGNLQISYKLDNWTKVPVSIFGGITNKSRGFVVGETFLGQKTYGNGGVSFQF
jgi:hypothetical protein